MDNTKLNHATKDSRMFHIFIVVVSDDFSFILGNYWLKQRLEIRKGCKIIYMFSCYFNGQKDIIGKLVSVYIIMVRKRYRLDKLYCEVGLNWQSFSTSRKIPCRTELYALN